jgi:hypothetical protein
LSVFCGGLCGLVAGDLDRKAVCPCSDYVISDSHLASLLRS